MTRKSKPAPEAALPGPVVAENGVGTASSVTFTGTPLPAGKKPRRVISGATTPRAPRGRARSPQTEPQRLESSLDGKKIAIIGAGAMGGALCRGLVNSRIVTPNRVLVADPHTAHVQELARSLGIIAADGNMEAARDADIILLAVKPYNVEPVLLEIGPALARAEGSPLLICIAAGIGTARIESVLNSLPSAAQVPVVRAMPNTPAQVGKGACAYCKGKFTDASHMLQAGEIFQSVGIAVEVPESMMDAVTALSGSGPAYIYLMIEALVDGGVRAGLPRDIAAKLASQTVLGAAQMVIDTGKHPAQLRDMVTTPAGTTIEAIASLEHSGLRAALIDAIGKAAQRSRELG
jgi:pyrroline-5-carboxylate reductase